MRPNRGPGGAAPPGVVGPGGSSQCRSAYAGW